MKILNESPTVTDKKTLRINCSHELIASENNGPIKVKFVGYNGGPVDLTDKGIEDPVYYDVPTMKIKNKTVIKSEHKTTIGHTLVMNKPREERISGHGLLSLENEEKVKIENSIKNRFPFQSSLGLTFYPTEENAVYVFPGQTKICNARAVSGPSWIFRNTIVDELTVCESGRDHETSFEILNQEMKMKIKNSNPGTPPVVPPTTPPEVTPPVVPPVVPAVTPPVTPPVHIDNSADMRKAYAGIMRLTNQFPDYEEDILKMYEEGTELVEIQNSIQYKDMEKKYKGSLPDPEGNSPKLSELEARFFSMLRIRPEVVEAAGYDKKSIEIANSKREMGFDEFLVYSAQIMGKRDASGFSDMDEILDHVTNTHRRGYQIQNSNFGTFDMPNLFSRASELMIDDRWELDPPIALSLCDDTSHKDFGIKENVRPESGELWKPVQEDGKIDLAYAGIEHFYRTMLETIAQLLTITRKQAINGDPSVIRGLFDGMVEGAMMYPDYQLGLLMLAKPSASDSFWVDDTNSRDSFAFTPDNLATAYQYVKQYKQSRGELRWNVNTGGKWKIIIPDNIVMEKKVYEVIGQPQFVGNTTANTLQGRDNFWHGKFEVMKWGNMDNQDAFGSTQFAQSSSWVLWPENKRFSPYVISFLNGRKRPTIKRVDLENSVLGFGMQGVWDVNVNEREPQAIHRAKAEATA